MTERFRVILGGLSVNDGPEGMVYVYRGMDDALSGATVGDIVDVRGTDHNCIPVYFDPSAVRFGSGVDKIWRVRILESLGPAEQPGPDQGFVRAHSVELLEVAQPDSPFAPGGKNLKQLVEFAGNLTRSQAEMLIAKRHPDAAAAHNRVWRAWLGELASAEVSSVDFNGRRFWGRAERSPVGQAIHLMQNKLFDRACRLEPNTMPPDDDEDWLTPFWGAAAFALADAALVMGNPELVRPEDRPILLQAWLAVSEAASGPGATP